MVDIRGGIIWQHSLQIKKRLNALCGKTQDQVKKMIAGNGVYICNECVDLSKKIIDDELRVDSLKKARDLPNQWKLRNSLINM